MFKKSLAKTAAAFLLALMTLSISGCASLDTVPVLSPGNSVKLSPAATCRPPRLVIKKKLKGNGLLVGAKLALVANYISSTSTKSPCHYGHYAVPAKWKHSGGQLQPHYGHKVKFSATKAGHYSVYATYERYSAQAGVNVEEGY
jgi:hypothetical protein